jgi:L-malate glycosyltransferase
MTRRVVIVQERLTQYRVPFFERLRKDLQKHDVQLDLVHGQGDEAARSRRDMGYLPWANRVMNREIRASGKVLVWQPVWGHVRGADLIVVEQASKLLVNYPFLASQLAQRQRIALWGHGMNLEANVTGLSRIGELLKRKYSQVPHWWFAYTRGVAQSVIQLGYPPSRITVVQNAMDTSEMQGTDVDRDPMRGVFVGGLYKQKRLDLLIETADRITSACPDFTLCIVGDGPERPRIEASTQTRPHLRYLGPLFGQEKARVVAGAAILLVPAAVGLVVLDSFATATPIVTGRGLGHGPEFEYLQDGMNSRVTAPDVDALSSAAIELLTNSILSRRLQDGCARAAKEYTLERMVTNFTEGVLAALQAPPWRKP